MRELQFTITGLSEQDLRRRRDRRRGQAAVLLAVLAALVILARRPAEVEPPGIAEVTPRTLVVDPSSLEFAASELGGPRQRRSLEIANDDAQSLSLAIRLPASLVFSILAETCSSTVLEPGRACTVDVGFDPRAAGDHRLSLSVIDDRQHEHPVPVSGTVSGPQPPRRMTITPSPLVFRAATVRSSIARRSLQVRNDDGESFNVAVRLLPTSIFSVLAQTCASAPLPVAGTCTVDIGFDPVTTGEHRAVLEVIDDRSRVTRVRISGSATGPPPPPPPPPAGRLELSPDPVVFPPQAVGTSSPGRAVSVTNRTGRSFRASYAPLDPATSASFAVVGTCNGFFFLAANSAPCVEQVTFKPRSGGAHRGSVSLLDEAGRGVGTLRLEGTGQQILMRVDPDEIDFSAGGSTRSVTVTNIGDAEFMIGPVRVVGPGDVEAFTHSAASCQFEALRPQASCAVPLRYTAGLSGSVESRSAALEVAPAGAEPKRVRLTWTRPLEPVIRAVPTSLDFPETVVNGSTTLRVTFTNTGNGPVTGGAVGFLSNESAFSVGDHECANLAPQGRCVVPVIFRPGEARAFRGTLRVITVNPPAQLATVPVTGTGVPVPPTIIVN